MMRKLVTAALFSLGLFSAAQAQGSFPGQGGSGQVLIGQGAAKPVWKSIVGDCSLDANGTTTCSGISGVVASNPTFTGVVTFAGTQNTTGLFQVGGTTQTFPGSGQLVGTGDTQVLTNKSIDASEINSGTLAAAQLPVGTNTAQGILSGDNSTLTVTAGAIACTTMTASQIGCAKVDNSTIVISGGALTAVGAVAASIGIGTTSITLGTPGDILAVGAGPTLTQLATTGTGNVVLAASPTLSGTIAGNLTLSGNLTFSGLAAPGAIAGSLCASAGGAVYYFAGNNCYGSGALTLNALTGNLVLSPVVSASGTSIVLPPIMPQGRLTFTTLTPVMTATAANQGTVYYDCYRGNSVPVFNGTIDLAMPITACQISTVMQTSGSGVLNTSGVFDVWAINVSGSLTLCIATNGSGGGWASDSGSATARGTGYSQLDTTTRPYWTNKNAITHCYNGATDRGTVAANQATYLGTLLTSGAGLSGWIFPSISGSPTAGFFGLWNAYNRVTVTGTVGYTANSWSYSSTTPREVGGLSTMLIRYVRGARGDAFQFTSVESVAASAVGLGGPCYNTTSSYAGLASFAGDATTTNSFTGYFSTNDMGNNFVAQCESTGGNPVTFRGQTTTAGGAGVGMTMTGTF